MAKKKTDDSAQQALEATPPDTVTKAEAIRRALAAGHDQPTEGAAYIKSEFGLDVSATHFSASKSQEKSKGAIKKAATRTRTVSPKPTAKSSPGEADLLSAMEAIKPLVQSMGADRLKRLVDLIG